MVLLGMFKFPDKVSALAVMSLLGLNVACSHGKIPIDVSCVAKIQVIALEIALYLS